MPVYGKGRTKRPLRFPLDAGLRRVHDPLRVPYSREELFRRMLRGSTIENVRYFDRRGKRVLSERERFLNEHTPLRKVNRALKTDLGRWIHRRYKETKAPVVVVDWGCGSGTSITELAKGNGKEVHAYGFSRDSFPSWKGNEHVKLIQESESEFHRFFKDHSIDLLYSHYGLYHYAGVSRIRSRTLSSDEQQSVHALGVYLMLLVLKLRPGGLLVANFPLAIRKDLGHFFSRSRHVVSYGVVNVAQKKGEFAVRIKSL